MKSDENNEERTGGNYPYHPLSNCLPIADAVKSLGNGKTPVSKSLLASSLKEDERSQTLSFKLASAKSFGIIEGRTSFSLTESAKRYYFPTDEAGRQNALLEFLEYPTAFKKLIERFDGSKLPTAEIISNILHRECDVPVSWKDRVATFFIKSAQFAVALDEQGHLRVKASRDGRPLQQLIQKVQQESAIVEAAFQNEDVVRHPRVAGQVNVASKVWTFTGDGKTLYVETPKNFTLEEWGMINQYIQIIKPKE